MFSLLFINSCGGRMDDIGDNTIGNLTSMIANRDDFGDNTIENLTSMIANRENFDKYIQDIRESKDYLSLIIDFEVGRCMDEIADSIEEVMADPSYDKKKALEGEISSLSFLVSVHNQFVGADMDENVTFDEHYSNNTPYIPFDEHYFGLNIAKKAKMLIEIFDLDYVWKDMKSREGTLIFAKGLLSSGIHLEKEGTNSYFHSKFIKFNQMFLKSSMNSSSITIEKAAEILEDISKKEKISSALIIEEYSKILGLENLTNNWKEEFEAIKTLLQSMSDDFGVCFKSIKADDTILTSLILMQKFDLGLDKEEVSLKVERGMNLLKETIKNILDKRLRDKKERAAARKALRAESERRRLEKDQKLDEIYNLVMNKAAVKENITSNEDLLALGKDSNEKIERKRAEEGLKLDEIYNLVMNKATIKENITSKEDMLTLGNGNNTVDFKILTNGANQVAILSKSRFYEKRNKKRKITQYINKDNENIRLDKGNDGKVSMVVKDAYGKEVVIKFKIVKTKQADYTLKSDYYDKSFN